MYEVSVSFRSVDCDLLKETTEHDTPCKPCFSALKAINRSNKQKSRSAAIPAKDKAPLAACGPEKLRATVQVTRLENKELKDRLKNLQTKIEKDGVHVSESLETDILKIMGGQNLEEIFLGATNGSAAVQEDGKEISPASD